MSQSNNSLTAEFWVFAADHHNASVHVKLAVHLPIVINEEEELARVHLSLSESIQEALRDAMRRLVSPTDADLCKISQTAEGMEEQLGLECAQTWLDDTLSKYGPGRFERDHNAGPWAIARVSK
jgi:hypothetical protein